MKYKKQLPDKRIFVEEVPHYHCSICNVYHPYDDMMKNLKGVYGVTRNCRKCYFKTYYIYTPIDENKRKQKVRRTREQIVEDAKIHKEMSHIHFWGSTVEDSEEVKNVMKRLGYNEDEPVWIQFNRRHGF